MSYRWDDREPNPIHEAERDEYRAALAADPEPDPLTCTHRYLHTRGGGGRCHCGDSISLEDLCSGEADYCNGFDDE